MSECILVYAVALIFTQAVVDAFRKIPRASWNGSERSFQLCHLSHISEVHMKVHEVERRIYIV